MMKTALQRGFFICQPVLLNYPTRTTAWVVHRGAFIF